MHSFVRILLAIWLVIATCMPVLAVNPDEVLEDPVLENRARELSVNIRCLVCQNQSIDDSDAQLARDLRVLVREQLLEGKTDPEILDFLVARYGEFVLLKPRFGLHTLALWGFPVLILLIGSFIAYRSFSQRNMREVTLEELSPDEQKALEQLVKEDN